MKLIKVMITIEIDNPSWNNWLSRDKESLVVAKWNMEAFHSVDVYPLQLGNRFHSIIEDLNLQTEKNKIKQYYINGYAKNIIFLMKILNRRGLLKFR